MKQIRRKQSKQTNQKNVGTYDKARKQIARLRAIKQAKRKTAGSMKAREKTVRKIVAIEVRKQAI